MCECVCVGGGGGVINEKGREKELGKRVGRDGEWEAGGKKEQRSEEYE